MDKSLDKLRDKIAEMMRIFFLKISIFDKNKTMTLVIDKKDSKNLKKILNEKLKKEPKKGNLSAHFGKLKRNLDGLDYQNKLRESED